MDVTLAYPEADLPDWVIEGRQNAAQWRVAADHHDQEAYRDADVVFRKNWALRRTRPR